MPIAARRRHAVATKRPKAATMPVASSAHADTREGWPDVALYLPEPPSANRWWRNVRGRMVLSREAREYKARVALFASFGAARVIRAPTTVSVKLIWHRGRKSGDLDKRLGVLLDALQGVAYENDSQITRITAERFDSPGRYSVVVHVTPNTLTTVGE